MPSAISLIFVSMLSSRSIKGLTLPSPPPASGLQFSFMIHACVLKAGELVNNGCTTLCNESHMTRTYTLKRRAEQQAGTRRRIVEATVDLHSTVGPALTTFSMVAERAGVQR